MRLTVSDTEIRTISETRSRSGTVTDSVSVSVRLSVCPRAANGSRLVVMTRES